MYNRVALQLNPSSWWPIRYTPDALRLMGIQVEALTSRHSSLKIHKRAIERQLAAIVAQINEQDVVLIPHNIFLLLEMRGSGGVGDQLDQIARIVHEQGYWKPQQRVQNYHRQDVYYLGKSVQKLFDDYTTLDCRVEQLQVQLELIKQCRQLVSEATPTQVFECLATASDIVSVQGEVYTIAQLLEQANHSGWFW